MRILISAVAVCAALASIGIATAQTYPTRPITLIVPYPAGGPTDTAGRIMAERMRVSLGQPVVIENVTGASGSIGTGRVARATSDGYTLGLGIWNTHVGNAALYTLPYDVVNDFGPVSLFVTSPYVILANKAIVAKDLKELIAWLKANPDKASKECRRWQRRASLRRFASKDDRRPLSTRALRRQAVPPCRIWWPAKSI